MPNDADQADQSNQSASLPQPPPTSSSSQATGLDGSQQDLKTLMLEMRVLKQCLTKLEESTDNARSWIIEAHNEDMSFFQDSHKQLERMLEFRLKELQLKLSEMLVSQRASREVTRRIAASSIFVVTMGVIIWIMQHLLGLSPEIAKVLFYACSAWAFLGPLIYAFLN